MAPQPNPRILTKEECMCIFRAIGVPFPGPLWDIYRWASREGEFACFNLVEYLEDDNLHLIERLV